LKTNGGHEPSAKIFRRRLMHQVVLIGSLSVQITYLHVFSHLPENNLEVFQI
jgi:hypothetical protein